MDRFLGKLLNSRSERLQYAGLLALPQTFQTSFDRLYLRL